MPQQPPVPNTLTLRHAALITGIAYLLNPVTFAEVFAMPRLLSTDPNITSANLTAHPHLFAAAILAYFVSAIGDIVLAWALYHLLAPVSRPLALLASLFQWLYAAAWFPAIASLGVLYRLVAIPDYATHLSPSALPTQTLELLAQFRSGWGLALILFALHLVLTGYLVVRSTYIPRWLGWLLVVNGSAWIIDSLSLYLYPTANLGLLKILYAGELIFMVWLLGWGWRIKEPPALLSSPA